MYRDDGGWIPIKLYVWTWTFEFHSVFTCHEIYCYYFFPQPLNSPWLLLDCSRTNHRLDLAHRPWFTNLCSTTFLRGWYFYHPCFTVSKFSVDCMTMSHRQACLRCCKFSLLHLLLHLPAAMSCAHQAAEMGVYLRFIQWLLGRVWTVLCYSL